MATHSIGPGKVMVSVPMDREMRSELGRYACSNDKSTAEVIRDAVKAVLKAARESGRIAGAIVFLALVLPAVFKAPSTGGDDLVRNVRRVRGKRKDGLNTLFDEGGEV